MLRVKVKLHAKTDGPPHLWDEIKSVLKAVHCVSYLSQQAKTSVGFQISHRNASWHFSADVAAAVAHKGRRWKQNPLSELYGPGLSLRIRWRPLFDEELLWPVLKAGRVSEARWRSCEVAAVKKVSGLSPEPALIRFLTEKSLHYDNSRPGSSSSGVKTNFRPGTLQARLRFHHKCSPLFWAQLIKRCKIKSFFMLMFIVIL